MQHNDYNVLIIFFNNFSRFKSVFDEVAKAKPKNLFLYQDGPRNENDMVGINMCREYIEKTINWECNVFKMFQNKNVGCDPSEYIAQKWAFSHVDMCIVLEDDDVPAQSFFPFCWELLKRYKDDQRIAIISGMNNLNVWKECDYDYFFTKSGCIWGWASWKRVIDTWDATYSWLDDPEKLSIIRKDFSSSRKYKQFIELAKKRRAEGKEYYETILGVSRMLNNQLNIVPKYNLIKNIGYGAGTHTNNALIFSPRKIRELYNKPTFSYEFPLKHPPLVKEDKKYKAKVEKQLHVSFFQRLYFRILRFIKKN